MPDMSPLPPPAEELSRLSAHAEGLVDFARASRHPGGGFAWLDEAGEPGLTRPVETWICCRMTHVFALAVLRGDATAAPLLDHGVTALRGRLRDHEHAGWYSSVDERGPVDTDKAGYTHAFVVLAAASAAAAGHRDGTSLLDDALRTFDRYFWDEAAGLVVDLWDRAWHELEDYRGVNANMHTVEAFLAAADVTGDRIWRDRAERITRRVVHGFAAANDYRLPEHFDAGWQPLFDYHRDEPAHPFRPYGVTTGHLLEWARLAVHVRTACGPAAPDWLLPDAEQLFARAVADGWAVDGNEGFVYTTDFSGRPVVRDRLHWVVAEAIASAWTLYDATADRRYLAWYHRWWQHARDNFVDERHGSWRHELDAGNRPASTVWVGKPDVYHAYQAAILPTLGTITSFAQAARSTQR
jgi:mannose/cellobiose epimerase-like protein (N-acyl-D-glucosamine 2-epimerase family)